MTKPENISFMNIENPLAYSFILQDDIYLLDADKRALKNREQPASETVIVTETVGPVFKYLGGHKKQYLVITHYPDADFMTPPHLTALENTLKRLGNQLDDIAIFNLARHPNAEFRQIVDFFEPQKMLILGKYALPSAISKIDPNKPQPVNNILTLFTFSFGEMMESVENKKEFWEAMKQL